MVAELRVGESCVFYLSSRYAWLWMSPYNRNIIRIKTKNIWNCQIKLYFSSWSKQCIWTKTKRKSWSWNITCSWVDNSSQWRYAFYAFTRSDWSISWFGCSTKYSPESGWNSCKRQGSTFRSSWVSIQFFFYSRAVDTW